MFSTRITLGDTAARTAVAKRILECEARYLLAKPLAWRREYLAAKPVEARRAALEAEMLRLHAERASKCSA